MVVEFPTRVWTEMSVHELIDEYGVELVYQTINDLPEYEAQELYYNWEFWQRHAQKVPAWAWRIWFLMSGRGSGKTRVGAELTRKKSDTESRIHLVGRTAADVRDVMIQGEALSVNTRIPTPSGFKKMGDIQIGDIVFDKDGYPTQVKWVSEVSINRPCFKVRFTDGSIIIADEKHKWITRSANDRRMRYAHRIRTTKQIKDTLKTTINQNNHSVPIAGPIRYDSKSLPVHPYVLGLWLGDGNTHNSSICIADSEASAIIEKIEEYGYTIGATWNNSANARSYNIKGLITQLKQLGLIGFKEIPEQYLRGSIDQRLDLLRGLMDSDGYCSTSGQCEFSNTIVELVDGVRELVCSLGMKVGTIQIREATNNIGKLVSGENIIKSQKPSFRLTFTPGDAVQIFNIPRKYLRQHKTARKNNEHFIDSVEPTKSVPVKCISVEATSQTYLVGDSYIPTHNSGILAVSPPWNRPTYRSSTRSLEWPNGSKALCFSADEPNLLRGPQCGFGWLDEIASWRYLEETYNNFLFGLRLGINPQAIATSTPRPVKVVKDLLKREGESVHVTRESTYANRANLAEGFFVDIVTQYEGTRLGQQEIHGMVLDDNPNALWTTDILDKSRVSRHPTLEKIVVAVDPSTADKPTDETAECGIIVAGRDGRKLDPTTDAYIIDDMSIKGNPTVWANQVIAALHRHNADEVVAEQNNGGGMIKALLQAVDPSVKVILVHASRGKRTRAEPVSTLYEKLRVHHVGNFPELEQQYTEWEPGMDSPDRLDAGVWAVTHLMIGERSRQARSL